MEKKEMYSWALIILVAVVALAFVYVEFFATSSQVGSLVISLGSSHSALTVYPYQSVFVPVSFHNNGASYIKGLGVGIFLNNNLSSIYNVSIPSGNTIYINYSKQFTIPGTYNVTYIADPSKLYNLENRSAAESNFQIVVLAPQTPAPYSSLQPNFTSETSTHFGNVGYLTYSYFTGTYGLSRFDLSQIPAATAFFNQFLNLTYSYIENAYSADVSYKNASAYSLWIQGSLSGNSTEIFAKGLKLNYTNQNFNGNSVAVITLDQNTTLCSWYSGGYLKNLVYEGNSTCVKSLANAGATTPSILAPGKLIGVPNSTLVANYSTYSIFGKGYSNLYFSNTSVISEGVYPNTDPSQGCYGYVNVVANYSYCTTYLFPPSQTIGKLSLLSTKVVIGQQNATILSLVNTSLVPSQITTNIDMLSKLNLTGISTQFITGINSSCSFNSSLSCQAPVFVNSTLSFKLYNKLIENVTVNSLACFLNGTASYTNVKTNLGPLASANFTVPCYQSGGGDVLGLPVGLGLNLRMNYTIPSGNFTAFGKAFVI